MTKPEFKVEFDRMTKAGYRLPEGFSVTDIMDEWFDTFQHCQVAEFAAAIDRLKRTKTDTFWPAIGALYQDVQAQRHAHYAGLPSREYPMASDEQWKAAAAMWRDVGIKLGIRKADGQ